MIISGAIWIFNWANGGGCGINQTVIQSLVRAISILRCFEEAEELGVTEVSRRIGLHKSTTFNIMSTLERYEFLEKNESTGKYRLGLELFRIGTRVRSDIRRIAIPYLEKLVAEFKETVNLVVRDGDHVVYLEKIESPHSMRIGTTIGGRLPVHATAVGKAILSGIPDNQLMRLVDGLSFVQFTANTIRDKNRLLESVRRARETGYAEDLEELEIGLVCVAAPVFDHSGRAVAAISVSGPITRMTEGVRSMIGKSLVDLTRDISARLGCNLPWPV